MQHMSVTSGMPPLGNPIWDIILLTAYVIKPILGLSNLNYHGSISEFSVLCSCSPATRLNKMLQRSNLICVRRVYLGARLESVYIARNHGEFSLHSNNESTKVLGVVVRLDYHNITLSSITLLHMMDHKSIIVVEKAWYCSEKKCCAEPSVFDVC